MPHTSTTAAAPAKERKTKPVKVWSMADMAKELNKSRTQIARVVHSYLNLTADFVSEGGFQFFRRPKFQKVQDYFNRN